MAPTAPRIASHVELHRSTHRGAYLSRRIALLSPPRLLLLLFAAALHDRSLTCLPSVLSPVQRQGIRCIPRLENTPTDCGRSSAWLFAKRVASTLVAARRHLIAVTAVTATTGDEPTSTRELSSMSKSQVFLPFAARHFLLSRASRVESSDGGTKKWEL